VNDNILEVKSVCKSFPGVKALDEVSLSVRKGEIHAVVGENGAGKSTLMKILSGAYHLDAGEIAINGEKVMIKNARDANELGVSIVYQELSNFPALSVAENIYAGNYPTKPYGAIDYKEIYSRTKKVLDVYGLTDLKPQKSVRQLSVGRQQVVEILKATSKNSRLLILDEPTSALTETETALLFNIMRKLKQNGVSIIYISHRLDEIFEICDRVTVLRDGCFIKTLIVKDTNKAEIVRHMVGREVAYDYGAHTTKTGNVLLEVKNLSYGQYIKDVSFELKSGEVLGVAGLEGAGRTELIECLFGVLKKDSGQILINGKEVSIASPIKAKKNGLAYITKERKKAGLFIGLSVDENIVSGNLRKFAKHSLIDFKKARKNSEYYVERFNIKTPKLDTPVMSLSGGNQQKVLLASWFTSNPRILLVDEPTRGIDVGTKEQIHKLIRELAKDGVGVVMISSDLPEILGASDRVMVMYEGTVTGVLVNRDLSEETIVKLASNEVN
jgi:ABC-type sugar transport system ATPase subunit